jgi:hypothetical protein
MKLIQTTFDKVPVGGVFYGHVSKERYTKIGCSKVRAEEGSGKGDIWDWRVDVTVLIEAPQTPSSKERKPWHTCYLCEHGPPRSPCRSCEDYNEWEPRKAMLEWHEDMMIKEKLG